MPACSTHVHHRPTFLIQFLSDSRISLVSILPMTQHRLHTRNKNKRRIPVCHHPVQRPHFLDLNGSHQHLQLHWWHWQNYHPSFQSLAQPSLQWYRMWRKWHEKSVPGKKCLDEIQERKRNFMNIIPSTCFKQFFYYYFLLTVKPKQSQSHSIHFPGIASCLHLSSGRKTIVFETHLVQWNVGQSSCHDSCLGNR